MVNAPLTDALAVRAAFISTVRDGYASNGLSGADDRSMRLKLGYTPSENLTAVLTYEYTKVGGKSQGDGYVAFEDQDDVGDPWTGKSNGDIFSSNTQTDRFYMNLDWRTPIGDLTFIPSYSDTKRHNIQAGWLWSNGDFGFQSMDPTATKVLQAGEHFVSPQDEQSYELRLASREDFFMSWLVGLYYYERTWKDKIFHKDVWGPAGLTASTEETAGWKHVNNPSWSVFANATYPVTDMFRVTLGGRFTADEETIKGTDPFSGQPTDEQYDSDHFDYKLALEYDLGDNSMLWVDHSTGYKHVMRNSASQELDSYQVGIKNRFMDNRLQLNASAFYYDYSNFDIGRVNSEYLEVDGEILEYQGSGIGDATLYGIDVSSDIILTESDRVNLSLSYLSAEVDEVVVTYSYQGTESPLVPPQILDAGKRLNNSPEWSIVGTYEHRFNLPGGGSITPDITLRYKSKYFCEFYPNARDVPEGLDAEKANTEPSKLTADAALNFRHPSGNWSLNAYVKNITNHAEKTGFMRGDLRLGPPRTYGAVLSIRF
jgi:iron complex outermembrane receptor protein